MRDIVDIQSGQDMRVDFSVVPKAANVCTVQIQSLEYAQTFGVDLKFFLQEGFQFQNESFRAYLIDRLTQFQVNVSEVLETIETLVSRYTFTVSDNQDNSGALIS